MEFYKISHMMKEKRREREELVDEIVDKIKTYKMCIRDRLKNWLKKTGLRIGRSTMNQLALPTIWPVSYTHLDVYKRQG